MPLTPKGEKILKALKDRYGDKEGERIFYAMINNGRLTGVHRVEREEIEGLDEVSPPGWEGTVRAMKRHKAEIAASMDLPPERAVYALAWAGKRKGHVPRYKERDGHPVKKKRYRYEEIVDSLLASSVSVEEAITSLIDEDRG